ncbi:Homocysteine-responsive endoplasmic reticulum-resident ubiquitin-like domain member 2 protein [Eumeta japonica]|uniref:Homocysteine-responsive endoplasmic reticulum-resident ubiquitin-like domain member 2 protein n=1 Tax=Eumeta variegata TaxID=151549 RepID=A0A4C1WTF0_EUMVA|nr:Homocysteine-responsive endoplasmic reticulum-resident ubiquitin-like domain member 2 protein [Eumeta japonica]
MWQAGGGTAVPGTRPMNAVNEVPPQPAAEPPEPVQDDDAMPRDWLDLMYAGSRLAILFSLVYFYSSPFRLMLVALLCAMGYLHQVGFFRDVNAMNENQPLRNEPVRQENPRAPEQDNPEPQVPQTTDNTQINQQSLLAATWMIFTSFFTSLIPETN